MHVKAVDQVWLYQGAGELAKITLWYEDVAWLDNGPIG